MHGFRWPLLLLVAAWLAAAQLHASNAILLWPLDPVVEAAEPGAALWVENRGQRPATMQVRVLAWTQDAGEHRHGPQDDIIGTPAIFRVEPGQRQFIRLTRTRAAPAGTEQAYRVLIDELPDARSHPMAAVDVPPPAAPVRSGLRFQLRYSIPLFSYGAGLASRKHADVPDEVRLQWRQGGTADARWIEIRNAGRRHAKLVDLDVRGQDGQRIEIDDGHLGYVLAGSTARWTLRGDARVASVRVGVNGGAPRAIDAGMP